MSESSPTPIELPVADAALAAAEPEAAGTLLPP